MKIVPLVDAKALLSACVDQCSTDGPLIITRNGKPAAVLLVPKDDEDLDCLMLFRSPRYQVLMNESRGSIAASKRLSRDEFWNASRRHGQSQVAPAAHNRHGGIPVQNLR